MTATGAPARVPAPRRSPHRGPRWASAARYTTLLVVLAAAVVLATLLAVSVGAVGVPLPDTWRIIAHHVAPGSVTPTFTTVQDRIVWDFRMPRALLAILVGAGLALVGAVLQAVVRNPLADPFLLGVSSGASLGAVLVLVLGSQAVGGLGLSAAAFLGSLAALGAVYLLAQRSGRITAARLLLSGVAMAYLFQALFSFVLQQAQTGQVAQQVLFWLLGSLAGARWDVLPVPTIVLAAGLVVLLVQWRPLNALLAGEEIAASLGINVTRLRGGLFALTALLVGCLVAVSGAIAFVGLIVPHVARLLVGSDHRRVLPVTALAGAAFLLLADLAARTLAEPQELGLSIVTALAGVPFFLWLLRRRSTDAPVNAA
ncbi:MAG: FecCD family ABC transporter permease [Pseudonocardiaceae bacterium]